MQTQNEPYSSAFTVEILFLCSPKIVILLLNVSDCTGNGHLYLIKFYGDAEKRNISV
jgi:hypothetical protein